MKKFIFGLMLLVSMLGIVGCANPSNSDDSAPVDETEYTLINKTNASLLIAYLSNSETIENPKIVAANESYTVKKHDVCTGVDNTGIVFAGFYITSDLDLNQDLTKIPVRAIPVQESKPSEITQEYYDNYLKN